MANTVPAPVLLNTRVLRNLEAVPIRINRQISLKKKFEFTDTKTRIRLPMICLVYIFILRHTELIVVVVLSVPLIMAEKTVFFSPC